MVSPRVWHECQLSSSLIYLKSANIYWGASLLHLLYGNWKINQIVSRAYSLNFHSGSPQGSVFLKACAPFSNPSHLHPCPPPWVELLNSLESRNPVSSPVQFWSFFRCHFSPRTGQRYKVNLDSVNTRQLWSPRILFMLGQVYLPMRSLIDLLEISSS